MRLIGMHTSPFTRKVRIVAFERQISLEFVVDMPLEENTSVPLFNPLGKVPVLVLDDGSTLIDSPLIAAWFDGFGQGERLIPATEPQRMAVLQWEALADGVLDAGVLMRLENLRPENERSPGWLARQQGKVERGLSWMSQELGKREWCVADRFTLADVAVGCCLSWLEFRFPQDSWSRRFPELGAFCARLEQRPSFAAAMLRA